MELWSPAHTAESALPGSELSQPYRCPLQGTWDMLCESQNLKFLLWEISSGIQDTRVSPRHLTDPCVHAGLEGVFHVTAQTGPRQGCVSHMSVVVSVCTIVCIRYAHVCLLLCVHTGCVYSWCLCRGQRQGQHTCTHLCVGQGGGAGPDTYLSLNPRITFWRRMTLSVMALSRSTSSSMSWWSWRAELLSQTPILLTGTPAQPPAAAALCRPSLPSHGGQAESSLPCSGPMGSLLWPQGPTRLRAISQRPGWEIGRAHV